MILTTDADVTGQAAMSERCYLLHRPVHALQLRTTIRTALARRHAGRAGSGPPIVQGQAAQLVDSLRPRERQVGDLLLQHYRVPAMAAALGISAHTVRNHLKNIYRRVGVGSQQALLNALTRFDVAN